MACLRLLALPDLPLRCLPPSSRVASYMPLAGTHFAIFKMQEPKRRPTMSLREYRRKRDFQKTPEPAGKARLRHQQRRFVVQKHAARNLHYDFRLELDGVLKSWAVPKGPTAQPKAKSLAVEVEDHPLDYADFEGIIPRGQYGGGTVMVWDRGTWNPEGDAASDLRRGKLNFSLQGKKLHGRWTLVRMAGREDDDGRKNWLLIKRTDEGARSKRGRAELDRSVISGRSMDEIAADPDSVWQSGRAEPSASAPGPRRSRSRTPRRAKRRAPRVADLPGARPRPLPEKIEPHLATLVAQVPDTDAWLHEMKYDGYRILARIDGSQVDLLTRRGNNWTDRFPAVAQAVAELGLSAAFLDGEVVALDEQGRTDFQRLQNWMQRTVAGGGPRDDRSLVYFVFDAPYLEGYDLRQAPLADRKAALAKILPAEDQSGPVRYSDHVRGRGAEVIQLACQSGMEGIISKRADSPYAAGRSACWVKTKCLQRQEFVIGGYTQPSGSRTGFGSLLLGYYRKGQLRYAGHVGTGFTRQSLTDLTARLEALRTGRPAFENPPRSMPRQRATWVEPKLVAEVEFAEWTEDGVLRQPSFKGLREDKPASQITVERPARLRQQETPMKDDAASADESRVAGIALTHPDRVLYPDLKLTKLGLAQFYESIAEWVVPHLANRPLTLLRCPEGLAGSCFFQKHLAEKLPPALRNVSIREKSATRQYVVLDDLPGLIALVQRGALELHPWPAPADDLEHPDRLVIDLDPGEGVPWKAVVEAAREVRDYLAALELTSFVRTTGGKGLHVVVPLSARATWEEHKQFAAALADTLVARVPQRYIASMKKALRGGKIFVDYLRNQRSATSIASYSSRARAGAPVATPLSWKELSPRLKPERFTVETLPKRLATLSADPWDGFFTLRQSLTERMLEAAQNVLADS